MIKRMLEARIADSLTQFPVVGIIGSRQTGKTTLAKLIQERNRNSVYLDLELPSDLNRLREPELYLNQHGESLVILDEVQRMPGLFPVVRALVDRKRVPGRFLILGSASPEMIRESSESLAGRVMYHELSPFSLEEVGHGKGRETGLWLRGGYPDSFLARDPESSLEWREAFIRTYLERDIPQLGIRVPAGQLRHFWIMIAHYHGQLWNASQIAGSLGVSAPTVRHYLSILEDTFLVRQLQPYHANLKKRLVKSPKVYIRDSGLLHALLGIGTLDDLQGRPLVGHSWEGFVIEQVVTQLPPRWQPYFFRTAAGAEVDLLLVRPGKKPIAVEVKYSAGPELSRGLRSACLDLHCRHAYVIYPGNEPYPLAEDATAMPLEQIGKIFREASLEK
ncbi:MAG: ATP-binding protein [Candidatus Aminicenantes bacterium]|nr:ATP-binding protein [Candidatus Aminicenantes bacterium]